MTLRLPIYVINFIYSLRFKTSGTFFQKQIGGRGVSQMLFNCNVFWLDRPEGSGANRFVRRLSSSVGVNFSLEMLIFKKTGL